MNEQRILSLAGLSAKAGKALSGEFQCEEAVRSRKAHLVLIASDSSGNTRKKFVDKCAFYHIPCMILEADKAKLGHAVGKEERACVALMDKGLADSALENPGKKPE